MNETQITVNRWEHPMAHDHTHHHHTTDFNRAFAAGVALNLTFLVVEAVFGIIGDSMALLADAGHNLSDVMSLLLAWGAHALASRSASERRTYGFRRLTILASLASAVLLFVALGGIAWEAFQRFSDPAPVDSSTVIIVAGIGVIINTATALLFLSGKSHDLNIRGAYLHMAADAGVSLGVVIAGAAIALTGRLWIDPAISLVIVAMILAGSWSLFRDSVSLSIDSVPRGIDSEAVRNYLKSCPEITGIHDLHIWALSTTETALTAHLVTPSAVIDNELMETIEHHLDHEFGISHVTLQLETEGKGARCSLDRKSCI